MTQKQRYLLDTHAAVWLQLEPARLGAHARQVLSGAAPNELYISDVTLSETARLLKQNRIETAINYVDKSNVDYFIAANKVYVAK